MEYSTTHYRSEPFSVLDLCNSIIDLPITLLICADIGSIREPIFYDQLLTYDSEKIIDNEDLDRAKQKYIQSHFHQQVLNVIADAELDLFGICDKLDTEEAFVFEPKVEYALWDLRPLLNTRTQIVNVDQQTEQRRFWKPFHSEVLS